MIKMKLGIADLNDLGKVLPATKVALKYGMMLQGKQTIFK